MPTHLGVYPDNKLANVQRFDSFISPGRAAWFLGTIMDKMPGYANPTWIWSDQVLGKALTGGRWINFSVGMWPTGGSRAEAAKGAYKDAWTQQARGFVAGAPRNPRGKVQIRLGWEFNIGFPWKVSSESEAPEWIAAFRALVDTYRAVDRDLFEFVWCPNYANGGVNVEAFYPGAAYVDVVGLDYYWKEQYEGKTAEGAWAKIRDAKFGLAWQVRFARARGKMLQASEWAVPGTTNVGRAYLQNMRAWFIDNGYIEAGYWDSDKDTDGQLSNRRGPATADAFKELFGMAMLPDKGGPTPLPEQPAETGGGTTTPSPTPQDPALALNAEINGAAYLARGKHPEPANSVIRAIEDATFWPLVGAGIKNGDPAGKETDPAKALAAVVAAAGPTEGWPAEAAELVEGWADRARALLPETEEPPAEEPPAEQSNAEVEALKVQIAELQAKLTAEQTARTAAEEKVAAMRAILA